MMNVVALAFLLSYFSAVVVLVPEPHLTQADHRDEGFVPTGIFHSAKDSTQNVVCDNEPCPSSIDQVKKTVHNGYEKTAEGIDTAKEGAKETVKGVYGQAKHGVQDKTEQAKQGIQDKVGKAKYGAHETVHGIQDKAGQAKQGVYDSAKYAKEGTYETAEQAKESVKDKAGQVKHGAQEAAEKVASYIPSTEDVQHGAHETGEKLASYIPSKEEAASYIPGAETGKVATNVLKQKVGEAKERVSYVEDSAYGKESLDSLRSKLDEARQAASQFMQGREKESAYPSFADMKKKLDEASAYIPSKETAASYIPGVDRLRSKLAEASQEAAQFMQGREKEESYSSFANMKKKLDEASAYIPYIPGVDSIQQIKKGVQETAQSVQDKVQDVGGSARDAAKGSMQGVHDKARVVGDNARDTTSSYKEAGEGKIGGMFQGMKERFTGGQKGRDGSGPLVRRVHELCMWFGDDSEIPRSTKGLGAPILLDVAATRESYAYLMQSALSAIERAHELFEHATMENAGGEWREKYVYLADSAKGALEAAKEVFERAASAAEGTMLRKVPTHKVFAFGKAKNMSKLGEVAAHTKDILSATLRPLLRTLYLASFSAIYGISLWMTFLSGHLLARTLPRQQLGIVQSKLFPVYLRMITGSIALCGLIHALLHPWPSADRPEHWQYANFAICIGLSLLNMLLVEPRATKMMFEKLRVEKEEGRGQTGEEEVMDEAVKKRIASIDAKFKGLHQMASYLNLAIVAGLTWHLWYLANRLVV